MQSQTQLNAVFFPDPFPNTFILYGVDKAKAKLDAWRISEKTLMIWSLVGGIGGMVGMNTFRHKTRKPKFKTVNTVGLLLNLFAFTILLMR